MFKSWQYVKRVLNSGKFAMARFIEADINIRF